MNSMSDLKRKDFWLFVIENGKQKKVTKVIAKEYTSAEKQVYNRFPKEKGWEITSYRNPDGITTEIHL